MSTALEDLVATIRKRKHALPSESWTAKLLSLGLESCAKKFSEEAIELSLATIKGDKKEITAEAADVIFHFLILLEAVGVDLNAVYTVLEARKSQSGLQEKASRQS